MYRLTQVGACVVPLFLWACQSPPSELNWVHGPALVFDREPGAFSAEAFAHREPLPATDAPLDPNTYYSEWYYDRQGTHFYDQDYFTRQVWAVREGRGRRGQ